MNPSYESGGLGTPGVKPGMITSLPEQPAPDSPRPMKLGGGGSGPNKKLVIFAVLIVVILVAVIAGVMMMGGKSGGNDNNSQYTPQSTEEEEEEEPTSDYTGKNEDFYRYANYILNGTNESKTLPSYNENKEYAVMTAVESRNNEYFQIADNLWSTFYNRISKDSTKFVEGSKLYELVRNQNLLMDFFTKYTGSKDWTEDEMWASYRKNGLDSTIQTVRADYEKIAKTSYEAGANWAKLKADWNVASLKLYDAYDAKGCVKENDFDQECINNNLDNFARVIVDFKEADSQLENLNVDINVLLETLIKNCFDIKGNLDETEK